jgi:hypothetical protein
MGPRSEPESTPIPPKRCCFPGSPWLVVNRPTAMLVDRILIPVTQIAHLISHKTPARSLNRYLYTGQSGGVIIDFLELLHILESVTLSFFSLMLAVNAWFHATPEFLVDVEPDGMANGACQKKVNFKLLPCP